MTIAKEPVKYTFHRGIPIPVPPANQPKTEGKGA